MRVIVLFFQKKSSLILNYPNPGKAKYPHTPSKNCRRKMRFPSSNCAQKTKKFASLAKTSEKPGNAHHSKSAQEMPLPSQQLFKKIVRLKHRIRYIHKRVALFANAYTAVFLQEVNLVSRNRRTASGTLSVAYLGNPAQPRSLQPVKMRKRKRRHMAPVLQNAIAQNLNLVGGHIRALRQDPRAANPQQPKYYVLRVFHTNSLGKPTFAGLQHKM